MASQLAREKSEQAWCTDETKEIVMNPPLAEAFAKILDEVWNQPWLGNATTRQLLGELTARIEVNGEMDYKPCGKE